MCRAADMCIVLGLCRTVDSRSAANSMQGWVVSARKRIAPTKERYFIGLVATSDAVNEVILTLEARGGGCLMWAF